MADRNETRAPGIYGGTISLTVLATLLVITRLVARKTSASTIWWDDITIVIALVFDWGQSACYWIQIIYGGFGRHTVFVGGPVGPVELTRFFKLLIALQLMYFASALSIKTSLLLLYYRLFGVLRWFRWLLAAVWAVVVLNSIVCSLVAVFECRPVAYFWDKSIAGGSCINQTQFYRWNGVANLFIDFVIWSITLPVIWHRNLTNKQKMSLSALFLLGLLACVASIVRVWAFNQVKIEDPTYTLPTAATWSIIEQSVGIVCACLPTLRVLFRRFMRSMTPSNSAASDVPQSRAIPLSRLTPRSGVNDPDKTVWDGFARLNEGNNLGVSSTASHATRVVDEDLPSVPHHIFRQQRLEQHVEAQ